MFIVTIFINVINKNIINIIILYPIYKTECYKKRHTLYVIHYNIFAMYDQIIAFPSIIKTVNNFICTFGPSPAARTDCGWPGCGRVLCHISSCRRFSKTSNVPVRHST